MRQGFTLIELMVVITIMGILAMMGFYGLSPARENEKLANAQKELISNLRSAQNKAIAGANGGARIDFTYIPPTGITVSGLVPPLCFYNPNLATSPCGVMTFPQTVTLSNATSAKQIRIEGSNNRVTNIYAL